VPKRKIARTFAVPEPRLPFDIEPRYNIAPTQPALAVRQPEPDADREAVLLKWGLVPPWARDPKVGVKHINARSETVADRLAFRYPFRKRRCLLPADGFYEWAAAGRRKQPFLFTVDDSSLFGFAGLWEHWEGKDGELIESCTILTTEANELVRPVHDRMPVILHPKDYPEWLDPELRDPKPLQRLLKPYSAKNMVATPVSTRVNSPRNDDPECVEPIHLIRYSGPTCLTFVQAYSILPAPAPSRRQARSSCRHGRAPRFGRLLRFRRAGPRLFPAR
jgi:putative SOS response-associated peptidase YedK